MHKLLFISATFAYLFLNSSLVFAKTHSSESSLNSISATDPHIIRMGRIENKDDGSARFGFPGVSFFTAFEGKNLSLEALSSNGQNYIEVIVDKSEPKIIKLSANPENINLVQDAKTRLHPVEIIHRSETWHGTVTLKKFTTDGKFVTAPPLPTRKIMFLGDSVTCGEAIDRIEGGKKDTSWWNPRLSYGMLTAKAFKAQVNLVCMGGHGLVRSWNGKTDEHNLPDFYQFAIATDKNPVIWDHSQYDPDLIVSAIGTNDFSTGIPDRENYVATYVKLLKTLLNNHKRAQIMLIEGAILEGDNKEVLRDYLNEAAKQVADKRVHVGESTHYSGDKTDGHPTREQHAAMAEELIPQIKSIMKW